LATTIRSSRQRIGGAAGRAVAATWPPRHGWIALLLVGSLWGAACAGPKTTPIELFKLTPESAANKAMQTRQFETPNSDELLSASAAVLQDLGFQVTECDRNVGFLRAAKERSAREYGQEIRRDIVAFLTLMIGALGGTNTMYLAPVDLHQQINASLIAQPIRDDDKHQKVRIVFYRLVWKGAGSSGNQSIPPGQQKMEMIRDAEIYQQFFARLSKAVFLEAYKI
jgi:hypothetical protein